LHVIFLKTDIPGSSKPEHLLAAGAGSGAACWCNHVPHRFYLLARIPVAAFSSPLSPVTLIT
jgi:hypothetical protein